MTEAEPGGQVRDGATEAEPGGQVRVSDNQRLHRYELWVGDRLAGQAAYRPFPGGIALVHTEIDPAFEGRGLGGRLAAAALDDARARGLRINPVCPFIASYLDRHPAYADLVGE